MNSETWGTWLGGWIDVFIKIALYGLGILFVLFLMFMAWMILEDVIEKE